MWLWLALLLHYNKVPGVNLGWDLSVWSLHVHPVHVCVLSRYSCMFLDCGKKTVRLMCDLD